MNHKVLFALCVCGLWATTDSTVIIATTATAAAAAASTTLAALGIGALAVAKGALIGAIIKRGKRHAHHNEDHAVEVALEVAQQIDAGGCVAKLLCVLETVPEDQLTPAMATLKAAFGNPNEEGFHKLRTSGGIYDVALTFGAKMAKGNPKACNSLFKKCPLEKEELFDMLETTFAC